MLRTTLLAVAALGLTAAGCASARPDVTAEAGVPFRLGLDETAAVDGHTIRLVEVADGRCPTGAECVWAGEARLQLEVDGQPAELVLPNGAVNPVPAVVGGVEVAVQALHPYPTVEGSDQLTEAVLIAAPAAD